MYNIGNDNRYQVVSTYLSECVVLYLSECVVLYLSRVVWYRVRVLVGSDNEYQREGVMGGF